MKKSLNFIFLLIFCFIFNVSTKAVNISSDFEKCEKPTSRTSRLQEHSFIDFAELGIIIKNNIVTAVPYKTPNPFINKLPVKEGIFEGIDIGEWGGVVRFLPYVINRCTQNLHPCHFCGSTINDCSCPLNKISMEKNDFEDIDYKVEKNVYKNIFENVDYLEFKGMGMFIFSPRNNSAMLEVVNENCRGLFRIGNRNFAITVVDLMCAVRSKIYELIIDQDNCVANKIVEINCHTEAFLTVEDTAYIATTRSLVAFNNNQLHKLIDWEGFHSASMVHSDGCLFIGMREGWLCKYDLRTKNQEWYRYTGKNFV